MNGKKNIMESNKRLLAFLNVILDYCKFFVCSFSLIWMPINIDVSEYYS